LVVVHLAVVMCWVQGQQGLALCQHLAHIGQRGFDTPALLSQHLELHLHGLDHSHLLARAHQAARADQQGHQRARHRGAHSHAAIGQSGIHRFSWLRTAVQVLQGFGAWL